MTGASRGLGKAIAQTLFDHGMKVVISARSGDELNVFQRQLDRSGSRSLAVAADVTSAGDRSRLIAETRDKFGEVDVLVNNAGTDHPEFFADADFARVEAMVALNLTALMAMTQAVLPEMLKRGSGQVVNIASMAGLAPVPYAAVYSATKHAVIGFSESIRYEVAERGIGVSVVCPGYVREAGLYHENSRGSANVPTISPAQVGEAVVAAITGDRARVLATPAAMKVTPFLTAISPGLTHFASVRSGNAAEMRKMAESLKQGEAAPDNGKSRRPRRKTPAKNG